MVERDEIIYESIGHVLKWRLVIIKFFFKEVISKVDEYFIPWLQEKSERRPTWCVTNG